MCRGECIHYAMHLKAAFASASSRTFFNVPFASTTTTTESLPFSLFLYSQKDSIPFALAPVVVCEVLPSAACNNSAEKADLPFPSGGEGIVRRPSDVRPRRPRLPRNQELLTRGKLGLPRRKMQQGGHRDAFPESMPRAIVM